jgi:hypothetical protein
MDYNPMRGDLTYVFQYYCGIHLFELCIDKSWKLWVKCSSVAIAL